MINKILRILGLVFVVIIIGSVIIRYGCNEDKEKTYFECRSQDNLAVARFYSEYGGGAAGWVLEYVSIKKHDMDKQKIVLELKHGHDIYLHWIDNNTLEIGYPDTAEILLFSNRFGLKNEGSVELVKVKSIEGSFINTNGGCKN